MVWAEGFRENWRLCGCFVNAEGQKQHLFEFNDGLSRYYNPICVCRQNGELWIVYECHRQHNSAVMATLLSPDGQERQTCRISDDEGNAYDPSISLGNDDTLYCAWTQFHQGSYRVAWRAADTDTRPEYVTPLSSHAYYPGLSVSPAGGLWLSWVSYDGPKYTNPYEKAYVKHELRRHVQSFWLHQRRVHAAFRDQGEWKALDAAGESSDGEIEALRGGLWSRPVFFADGTPVITARVAFKEEEVAAKFTTLATTWRDGQWTEPVPLPAAPCGEIHPPAAATTGDTLWNVSNVDGRDSTVNTDYLPGFSILQLNTVRQSHSAGELPAAVRSVGLVAFESTEFVGVEIQPRCLMGLADHGGVCRHTPRPRKRQAP